MAVTGSFNFPPWMNCIMYSCFYSYVVLTCGLGLIIPMYKDKREREELRKYYDEH